MQILRRCLVLISFLMLGSSSFAATLLKSSSLFGEATEGSKQVEVLKKRAKVRVTGPALIVEGESWSPVTVLVKKDDEKSERSDDGEPPRGWLHTSLLSFDEGDVVENRPPRKPRFHIWGSLGPDFIVSNDTFEAIRLCGGADVLMGEERRTFLGVQFAKPFSNEELKGRYAGGVQRLQYYFSVGYYFLPEIFYARAGTGFALLGASHPSVVGKIKPSYLLATGYEFHAWKKSKLGVELSYEYTGVAQTSAGLLVDSVGNLLGDIDPTGTIPQANQIAVSAVYSFQP